MNLPWVKLYASDEKLLRFRIPDEKLRAFFCDLRAWLIEGDGYIPPDAAYKVGRTAEEYQNLLEKLRDLHILEQDENGVFCPELKKQIHITKVRSHAGRVSAEATLSRQMSEQLPELTSKSLRSLSSDDSSSPKVEYQGNTHIPLTPEIEECIRLAKDIPGWNYTEEQDTIFFAEKILPEFDFELVVKPSLKDLAVWSEQPPRPVNNFHSTFRTFCNKKADSIPKIASQNPYAEFIGRQTYLRRQ